jgi:hypothetical protein
LPLTPGWLEPRPLFFRCIFSDRRWPVGRGAPVRRARGADAGTYLLKKRDRGWGGRHLRYPAAERLEMIPKMTPRRPRGEKPADVIVAAVMVSRIATGDVGPRSCFRL